MQQALPFAELQILPFVNEVLHAAVQAQVELRDRHTTRVQPHYERDPDEHEYYLLGVGKALVEVLTCCEHLQNIPLLLSNYHETPSMKRAGINRQKHIVFHIESYIIRVQGILDRVLKLVDAVFHLLNDPKNCRAHIILKNVKVKHHASVLSAVKKLDKLLDHTPRSAMKSYTQARSKRIGFGFSRCTTFWGTQNAWMENSHLEITQV